MAANSSRKVPSRFLKMLRRRHLIDVVRQLVAFAGHRMRDTQLQEVASSMTLTTLLSLVPLLAVSLAVFAAFPSFEGSRRALEDAVLSSFLPQQYSEVVLRYLREFLGHASGLGAFGLAGLAVTALLLIDKFFVTVNRIFKVRTMRPWSQRAVIYWAILTLAPAAITLSLTLSGQMIRMTLGEGAETFFPSWALALFQILLQSLGYAALYKLVPNCRVPFVHAAVGGLAAALAGQLVKQVFEVYVTAGTLGSVYGAFVAFPVFLLWLYVNWILVFSGAALTATIPLLTSGRYADFYRDGNDFLTGVALLGVLVRARRRGEGCVTVDALSDAVDSHPEAVNRILSKLADAGCTGEIGAVKRHQDAAWALLCDPETTKLSKVADALLIDPDNTLLAPERKLPHRDEGLLRGWYQLWNADEVLGLPIARLADLTHRAPEEDAEEAQLEADVPLGKSEAL